LTLPNGFCATVFADGIGHARHLVVAPDGVVYVNTWSGDYYGNETPRPDGFLVALKDTTGAGKADVNERFGETVKSGGAGGTGIGMYKGAIYATSNVPPYGGTPCGRACRRWNAGTLRCREGSRGTSTERTPSRDTDPNRTNSSDSYHHNIGPRSSGTLGGEGTRSVGRRQCAQCSSSIVTAPWEGAKHALNAICISNRFAPKRMYRIEYTILARSLRKFPRTAV
jgi:hypothetical protein